MEIKVVKPVNFLFFRSETQVALLEKFIPTGQELFGEAVNHHLFISGALHWHYFGFSGDVERSFTLEVSLPVADVLEEYDGRFHFKRTEAFKCVSLIHAGSWLDMPSSYGRMMEYMAKHKLEPTSVNREIYINTDFKNPEANITEIQMGVR